MNSEAADRSFQKNAMASFVQIGALMILLVWSFRIRRSRIILAPAYAEPQTRRRQAVIVARDPNLENVHTAQEPTSRLEFSI